MKIASLIIGILLMGLSAIVLLISLLLPSMTNNRVNFEEALVGIIPSIIFFLIGFVIAFIGGISWLKGKQAASSQPIQHRENLQ